MSVKVITLHGPESRRSSIIPADGELLVTTDEHVLYVGDGSTPGGIKLTNGANEGPKFVLKTKTWNIKTLNGMTDYSPNTSEDAFLDPNKGIYIVFLSAARLVPDDYTINFAANKITLADAPTENNLDLTLYYIGEE